jgi:hypothetical protein
LIATPLLHISFFPDFTQVNFLLFATAVLPAFLQELPALTAASALKGVAINAMEISPMSNRFTFSV